MGKKVKSEYILDPKTNDEKPHTLNIKGHSFREEKDSLGQEKVPIDAYYGIHTLRALQNFPISDTLINAFPDLIKSLAMVKKAAALANMKLKILEASKSVAIQQACDEIIAGKLHKEFIIDVIQGGAGTSTNMNANEVIANRALEIIGEVKGNYDVIDPLNDVNRSQSTNDVYPTAIRLAILLSTQSLESALSRLSYEFKQKSVEYSQTLKIGRTQLQDAVPMTVGQEFKSYSTTIKEELKVLQERGLILKDISLGATAIGTGINAHPEYALLAVEELCHVSGIRFNLSRDLVEATWSTGPFVSYSGILKRIAVTISKIANDFRLLSSGPMTGINEYNLPAVQAGSSIMPGKVNPVIAEMVNQVAFQVIAGDLAITLASESGQLQLNAFEPVIVYNLLNNIKILTNAVDTFAQRCVKGMTVNIQKCDHYIDNSISIVTALNPYIGYQNSARIAKYCMKTGSSVRDVVLQEKLLSEEQLRSILSPSNMTQPRYMES